MAERGSLVSSGSISEGQIKIHKPKRIKFIHLGHSELEAHSAAQEQPATRWTQQLLPKAQWRLRGTFQHSPTLCQATSTFLPCTPQRTAPPSLQIKWKAVTSALQSARVRVFFTLSSCLGELGEINRCTGQHFWLHPATAITVRSDAKAPWGGSYWHYMGRLEEGDTNSMAQQAEFS